MTKTKDFSRYKKRRVELIQLIRSTHPEIQKGVVLLCAGFEDSKFAFRPSSTFYYYTGITEPGTILTIDLNGTDIVWVPQYKESRAAWLASDIDITPDNASVLAVTAVRMLGAPVLGYEIQPYSSETVYQDIRQYLSKELQQGGSFFAAHPTAPGKELEQRFMIDQLSHTLENKTRDQLIDISDLVAAMRRTKDNHEIENMYKAINVTRIAHEVAATTIAPGVVESEVQARIEYIFTASHASRAFASIVAGGPNATVLHYRNNTYELQKGDLVVVDIGAEYGFYSADISRTYPVSGTFTKRQKELYTLVLDTQTYIASIAQVGYWLNNKHEPEKSLNHLAHAYLKERGYDQYFTHGIGHYLGLDTHDVGDYSQPLAVGDVFTIEPGIYIPDEKIGIRIEDDYWLTKAGLICLSDQLPKRVDEIEALMKQSLQ